MDIISQPLTFLESEGHGWEVSGFVEQEAEGNVAKWHEFPEWVF